MFLFLRLICIVMLSTVCLFSLEICLLVLQMEAKSENVQEFINTLKKCMFT